MNILIRNYSPRVDPAEISAMIKVYASPEYYSRIVVDQPITVKDDRLKGPTVIITKQGNGNLCFEYLDEEEVK